MPYCVECGSAVEEGKKFCAKCGAAVPIAEGEALAGSPKISASPENPAMFSSLQKNKADHSRDKGVLVLRILGWLHITFFFLLSVLVGFGVPHARFAKDNAIGAAANALEGLGTLIGMWFNLLVGILLFIVASLRELRLRMRDA